MTEYDYMDAARNCDVLRDSLPINAAQECKRLQRRLMFWKRRADTRQEKINKLCCEGWRDTVPK